MRQIGSVCNLTLSVIDEGYQPEWLPETGPPTPCWLSNHPSSRAHTQLVTYKVEEGVRWGTIQQCPSTSLHCILQLRVAVNAVGKRRLIWDGRHVNAFLSKHTFHMEIL